MVLILFPPLGGIGAPGLLLAAAATGPVGWATLVGADLNDQRGQVTYDCWKPLLHDESTEPSPGKPLKEIIADPRIKEVVQHGSENPRLYTLVNVWNEKFELNPVTIPWTGQVVLHASKVC